MQTCWLESDDHHPEVFFECLNKKLAEGWKLAGAVQVCQSQSHGGYYHHLATLVKDEPVAEQTKPAVFLIRGGERGARLVHVAPGGCVFLAQSEFVSEYPEGKRENITNDQSHYKTITTELREIIKKLLDEEGSEGFSKELRAQAYRVSA